MDQPAGARLLACALVCVGCGSGQPCEPFPGETCLSLEVRGPGMSVDQVEVRPLSGFTLTDGRSPPTPGASYELPIRLAVLPGGQFEGAVELEVRGFLQQLTVGADQLHATLAAGQHLEVIAELDGTHAFDLSGKPDAAGADLTVRPGSDLAAPDLQTLADLTPPSVDLLGAATSCKTLLTASPGTPSGNYTINPTTGPLNVYCDMSADGGGWTIVFVPTTNNNFNDLLDYTIPTTSSLWSASTEVLLAFRESSMTMLGSHARFAIPAEWKTKAPFQYLGSDVPVSVSINNGAAENHTLRYGAQDFLLTCDDAWSNNQPWGRICITGTPAPFYDGFASGVSSVDGCQTSVDHYQSVNCTNERRFTIAIR